MATNLYDDLLGAIPLGPFYDASGTILPYSDSASSFSLSTSNPNTTYQVTLNGIQAGTVTTDVAGVAAISVRLALGDNTLTISSPSIQSTLTSYITTRHWASWLAAVADVLGPIDDQAALIQSDRDLATVSLDRVDAVWGRRLKTDNRLNYPADTYRELLQIVHQAYRRYGGTVAGLMQAVGAFTHLNPLVMPRGLGPVWYLGNQFTCNPTLNSFTRLFSAGFTGIQAGGATVAYNTSSSNLQGLTGSSTLAWNGTVFTWTAPGGAVGSAAPSTLTGPTATCTITAGAPLPGRAYTLVGPYDLSVNNNITLELDGLGPTTITITPATTTTSPSVVTTAINSALVGNPRYGSTYSAVAALVNNLATPVNAAFTAGAGTLATGTYFYRVSATNSLGETLASTETSLAITGPAGVNVSWTAVPGATGYKVYGRGTGAELLLAAVGAVTTYLDGGSVVPAGALPATNTTGNRVQITALSGSVILHPSDTNDAASAVFGIPWATGSVTTGGLPSVTSPFIVPATTTNFPTLDSLNTYYITLQTSPRRVYEVLDTQPTQLILRNSSDLADIPTGTSIYLTTELPHVWSPSTGSQPTLSLTITNPALLSVATDTFNVVGATMPDNWWMDPGTATATASVVNRMGWMHDSCLEITNGVVGSWTAFTILKDKITDFAGFPMDAGVWVGRDPLDTNTGDILVTARLSFDGGTTWVPSVATAVPFSSAPRPKYISIASLIPVTATSVRFSVTVDAATPAGAKLRLEKVTARVGIHTARQLGQHTVPRSTHRAKRGHLCLMWSPQPFVAGEQALLGLAGTGHVDTVSSAHAFIDRFDANEVSGTTVLNVAGYTDATGLLAGTATNMQMVVRSPARFSFMQPTVTSAIQGEVLTAPLAAPYNFTLLQATAQSVSKITLYEDGIPVTRDQLSFVDAKTLQLNRPPIAGAVYTVDYEVLIRFETQPVTVGATPTDRTWFADVFHLLGLDFTPLSVPVTSGLQFDGNFIATLPERSDQDQSTAQIVADDGKVQTLLNTDDWRFIGTRALQINPAIFDPAQLYTITYTARAVHPIPKPTATLEIRQGIDAASCAAAAYQPFVINQTMAPQAFFQMRVTYGNVVHTDDVRLYSLALKGLNTNGTGAAAKVPLLRSSTWTAPVITAVPMVTTAPAKPNVPLNSIGPLTLTTFNGSPAWSTPTDNFGAGNGVTPTEYYTITDMSFLDFTTMEPYSDANNPGLWTISCPLGTFLLPNGQCA